MANSSGMDKATTQIAIPFVIGLDHVAEPLTQDMVIGRSSSHAYFPPDLRRTYPHSASFSIS